MDPQIALQYRAQVEEFRRKHRTGLVTLVFKVVNEVGGWQASVRFTDAAGDPVKGIRVTLTPL